MVLTHGRENGSKLAARRNAAHYSEDAYQIRRRRKTRTVTAAPLSITHTLSVALRVIRGHYCAITGHGGCGRSPTHDRRSLVCKQ